MIIDKIKYKLFLRKFRKLNSHNFMVPGNFFRINKVLIGKNSYGVLNVVDSSNDESYLHIGSYCSIASTVKFILGGEHQLDSISSYPFRVMLFGDKYEAKSKGNIFVGDDVWICENAIISSGLKIGQGAIIASGAVVVKDVEPYSIVVGNPARHLRYRFSEKVRVSLNNTNIEKLFENVSEDNVNLLYNKITDDNINEIIKKLNIL